MPSTSLSYADVSGMQLAVVTQLPTSRADRVTEKAVSDVIVVRTVRVVDYRQRRQQLRRVSDPPAVVDQLDLAPVEGEVLQLITSDGPTGLLGEHF